MKKIRIGTRDSRLALKQVDIFVNKFLEIHSNYSLSDIEIVTIKTTGDKLTEEKLSNIGGKSLFTKEMDKELLAGTLDIAIHSLKDVTAFVPDGLTICCYLERGDHRDALVSNDFKSIGDLPHSACIGTSSIRREKIIKNLRPDISIKSLRGNIVSRLEKLNNNEFDAIILATAGLERLKISKDLYTPIDEEIVLPSVGQGVICVESRNDDNKLISLLKALNHKDTEICIKAERSFLEFLEADCSVPLAAYAKIERGVLYLKSMLAKSDSDFICYSTASGNINEAYDIGIKCAKELIEKLYSNG